MMRRLLRSLLVAISLLGQAGILMAEAPSILQANIYRDEVDVSRYLVSEKLHGVRAIWDGKSLRFRSGNEVHAPRWFVDGLPKQSLDGELWMGRGSFEKHSGMSAGIFLMMPTGAWCAT